MARDFRITNRLLAKYGTTRGCAGCGAKVFGDDHKTHSMECRARIEEAITKDDTDADLITQMDTIRKRDAFPTKGQHTTHTTRVDASDTTQALAPTPTPNDGVGGSSSNHENP